MNIGHDFHSLFFSLQKKRKSRASCMIKLKRDRWNSNKHFIHSFIHSFDSSFVFWWKNQNVYFVNIMQTCNSSEMVAISILLFAHGKLFSVHVSRYLVYKRELAKISANSINSGCTPIIYIIYNFEYVLLILQPLNMPFNCTSNQITSKFQSRIANVHNYIHCIVL